MNAALRLPLLFLVAIASPYCTARAADPTFDFIRNLGGKPNGVGIEVPKGLESHYYVFNKTEEQIKAAVEAELGPPVIAVWPGTIFVVGKGPSAIRVLMTSRTFDHFGSGGVVLVGTHEALAATAKRYDWKPEAAQSEDILFARGAVVGGGTEYRREGNRILATTTWTNIGYSDATVTIEDVQYGQCDPLESMPQTIVIGPLEKKTRSLTYPVEAGEAGPKGAQIYGWMNWRYHCIDGQEEKWFVDDPHPLEISLDRSNAATPKIAAFISEDATGRVTQVRSIKVTKNRMPIWEGAGPWESLPGHGVRVPAAPLAGISGDLDINAEYRELPNTRWRSATQRLSISSATPGSSGSPFKTVPDKTVALANGFEVKLEQEVDAENGRQRGFGITILKGGRPLAAMRTRALIEKWLPVDAFWGSHAAGNQYRYMDRQGRFKGLILAVVPVRGGCLVELGMDNMGPSVETVDTDFILRWNESDPTQWKVIDRVGGGFGLSGKPRRLINYADKLYLLSDRAVLALTGPDLRRRQIASLPIGNNLGCWIVAGSSGSRVLLERGFEWYPDFARRELDLATGKLSKPSRARLAKFGLVLPESK